MLTYSTRARGGVAHALKLAERLKAAGLDVTLYSLARSDDPASLKKYYRPVDVPFRIFTYDWSPDVMVRLERMIKAYASNLPLNADVYHAQDCVGGTALSRMKSESRIRAPVFRTIHHVDDFADSRLYEFEKQAVALAEHRFVVSKYWQEALRKDYGCDSIVTYNGLDVQDFAQLPERKSVRPTVLFVGGLEPRKGLEFLILAMQRVVKEVPEAQLISVAKTGFKATDDVGWFRALAERAGVGTSVEFKESVEQNELMQLYADCDLLAMPSRNEGWGLALMEAMACGKPVVATRVGGIPELVTDGADGVLVEPGDVKGLADGILRILADPALRKRMGAAGRLKVKQYSWDSTARVVLQAYERALSSQR